jgi:hypothetical protein
MARLAPNTEVAPRAARSLRERVAVSADVGPDLIVPLRRPSKVILYVKDLVDARALSLVQAQGSDDSNVTVRMPSNRSVFPVPTLTADMRDPEIEVRTWLLAHR